MCFRGYTVYNLITVIAGGGRVGEGKARGWLVFRLMCFQSFFFYTECSVIKQQSHLDCDACASP